MTTGPLVSVIIVNWNGTKWIRSCLDSLRGQTFRDFEIIFVDNYSSDESVAIVRREYPEAIIIENEGNVGFGIGNNIGVNASRGEIMFLMNTDTIAREDLFEKMILYKQRNNLHIVGPTIVDAKGNDIYRGRKLSIDYSGYVGLGKATFFIEGCALMISKRDYVTLGGFDEKYFMYSEDIDLCWRAQLMGMNIEICSEALIVHYGGGSSESTLYSKGQKHVVPLFRRYEVEKNNLRNVLKNYAYASLLWVLPLFFLQSLAEATLYLFTKNLLALQAIWKAWWWNLSQIGDTIARRRVIQANRQIGDATLIARMGFWPNKLRALLVVGLPRFK